MSDRRLTFEIRAQLAALLSRVYAPGCPDNAWQWAQKNIRILRSESLERHGDYDTGDLPGIRRMMEFFTRPHERVFITRKSPQLGYTLAYLIVICYFAATDPRNVLYAMDSAKEAKNISKRLRSLITTTAALSDSLTPDGEDDLQNLIMYLRGMVVFFVGSGAAGGFANKSVGIAILDELDLYEKNGHNGMEVFHRALDRIKDVESGKFIAGGKPEGWEYPTNQNYLYGTREEIFTPCPFCDFFQPFHFENMKFDHCRDLVGGWDLAKVAAETYFRCLNSACQVGQFKEEHKRAMLRAAECRPTNFGQDEHKPIPGWVSLWHNDLYSTRPQHSWGNLAVNFLTSQTSPVALKLFFLGPLALPKPEKKAEFGAGDIVKLAGKYEHGCMPVQPARDLATGAAGIIISTDRQQTRKRWSRIGFTANGEAFVIDYGWCLGYDMLRELAREPVWIGAAAPPDKELEAIRMEAAATGREYVALLRERFPDRTIDTAALGIIDEGFDTYGVRDFCHRTKAGPVVFFACKGVAHVNPRELVHENNKDFHTTPTGTDEESLVTVYHFNDDGMKQELYLGRIAAGLPPPPGAASRLPNHTPRLWLPANPDSEFCAELSAEHRGLKKIGNKERMVWLEPKGCNDGGDTVKTACVLWHVVKSRFAPSAAVAALDADGKIIRQGA